MFSAIRDKKAEGYVDSGVKILIAIVIGTLLLSGLYVLASENVLPTVKTKVESLFDYSGNSISPAQEKIVGDINGDSVVDDSDLDILLKTLNQESPDYYDSNLDINADGILNSKDLVRLMKIIAEQEE